MKRKDLLSALVDTALACLMAIAGVGCLLTAFGLYADMEKVAWTALFFALLGSVSVRLRRGWILMVLSALAGIWMLRQLDLPSNVYSLLHQLLSVYEKGYGWEVPEALLAYNDWDLTLIMQTICAFCALFAGIYLSHCLHALSALAVLIPVIPCIVVTDTVPDPMYLLLAILLLSLLALTHCARHTDTRQANRLTALLLIPVLLCGMLLFRQNPQSEYQPLDVSKEMFQLMEQLAEHIPFLNKTPNPNRPVTDASDTVYLDAVGPRPQGNTDIMEVVASQSGGLYLRGSGFTAYTGTSWLSFPGKEVMEMPGSGYLVDQTQTIQIHALRNLNIRYFPYYPGKVTLDGGTLEGEAEETDLMRYTPLRSDWKRLWRKEHGVLGVDNPVYAAMDDYTQLPAETYEGALTHLKKAGVNTKAGILQIADSIAYYVRTSAKYDLNTGRMPSAETDFALWFLDDSESGYCIHFATAATVLLRAAGIPARYVEGYLVDAVAGQPVQVKGEHAHAWVEYYVPELGWVILEATPGDGLPIVVPTEPTEPNTTKPTTPTVPTVPTEPTEPTKPTLPTAPTEPTGPTAPTEPTAPTQPTAPSQTTRPTTPTEPQGSTNPGIGGSGNDPAGEPFDWSRLLPVLYGILILSVLGAAMVGQWQLRLYLRCKQMAGTEFVHIFRRWRYACKLAKLCGHKEPKPLLDLVKKAKFSRNGLNDRELRQFDRYCAACIQGLEKTAWYQRLVLRLLFAAW